MNKSEVILEFNKIKEMLCELALSERAKETLSNLNPFLNEKECLQKTQETTQAEKIMESLGTPPLTTMKEIDKTLELCKKGSMLIPEQLTNIAQFISSCKRMKSYLKRAKNLDVAISYYGDSINDLSELYDEIDRSIRNGLVDDLASTALRDIRRKIEIVNMQVKSKLESLLQNRKELFTDGYVTKRNGHYVLPVKKEFKNQINGTVIDTSSTGGTCFIEPAVVHKLQNDLALLQIEEDNEVRKILYTLTAFVEDNLPLIKINIDAMEILDVIFAKGKLSMQMKAVHASITTKRFIKIKAGRHPLLNQQTCVPLDFEIGNEIDGVVITGPNTGGKTVALKTVGLLSMMAQSGLHVPASRDSIFSMHNFILCDIGDGQSITENLSTFSSHITRIIEILNSANEESLVLLDELGSGTDPAEGMGIAVSILEELRAKKCLFVATTHYPEIKEYAKNTPRLINARMSFDRENLNPLYQLELGEAGESCALYIAKRLGFPQHMLKTAQNMAYNQLKLRNQTSDKLIIESNIEVSNNKTNFVPKIKKVSDTMSKKLNRCHSFNIGDSVMIFPQKEIGIVYQTTNERGEIGVQVKGDKRVILHKRIRIQVPASELYPPDYDFSIIFDSVENRKASHKMDKGHCPDLEIKYDTKGETK